MYRPIPNEIFHVHTWRCEHAGEEQDYEYVEKAIELGADRIVFTDHCPFPGNPFRKRMRIEQLDEYVASLEQLRRDYGDKIEILIGLEVEYLPSFEDYYKELKKSGRFDLLIVGQHFFEHENGAWSITDKDKSNEHIGLARAIVKAVKTGYFDVIAHPDRVYIRRKNWADDMIEPGREIIRAAIEHGLYLEKNYSSMFKNKYWQEFWELEPVDKYLYGYDVHSVGALQDIWKMHNVENC